MEIRVKEREGDRVGSINLLRLTTLYLFYMKRSIFILFAFNLGKFSNIFKNLRKVLNIYIAPKTVAKKDAQRVFTSETTFFLVGDHHYHAYELSEIIRITVIHEYVKRAGESPSRLK